MGCAPLCFCIAPFSVWNPNDLLTIPQHIDARMGVMGVMALAATCGRSELDRFATQSS